MAVDPTPNLRCERVQSEGDEGKVARYNLIANELDEAMHGLGAIAVSGSSNVALTRTQQIKRVWKFTGTLTVGINATIDPALGSARIFMVWNATTGGFAITVKLAASTGIAVEAGEKVDLLHDGAEVYYAGAIV
jgi:hypothetical protein